MRRLSCFYYLRLLKNGDFAFLKIPKGSNKKRCVKRAEIDSRERQQDEMKSVGGNSAELPKTRKVSSAAKRSFRKRKKNSRQRIGVSENTKNAPGDVTELPKARKVCPAIRRNFR